MPRKEFRGLIYEMMYKNISCRSILGERSMNFKKRFFANIDNGRKSAVIVPFFLGFLFSAASRFNQTDGQFKPYDIAFLLTGCLYGLLFVALFLAFERGMVTLAQKRVNMKSLHGDGGRLPQFIAPSWNGMKRYVCITALCWILTYFLLFPGIVVGDTAVQIEQDLSGNEIADWHPFLETKIFGQFFKIGGLSHPMLGVGVFIALQMIVAIGVVSYVAYYVQSLMKIRHVGDVALVLLAVYPMAPLSFMTMNKDTTFTICFMLFCVLYCEVWRSRGTLLKHPSFLIAFVVVSLSAIFTKKTGSYLISVALILLIFMIGKKMLRCVAAFIGVMLLLFAQMFVPSVIFPRINVEPGPKQEMLAIPEQQLARIVRDSPGEFTEQERKIIDDVIAVGFNGIDKNYNNYLVDPIKGTDVPNEDSIGAFLKLWIKKGLEHPWQYIATEIGLQSGWISFSGNVAKGVYVYSSPTDSASANSLSDKVKWPEASTASSVWASWYTDLSNTPILNLPMYVCVWATIIPFGIVFFIWRKAEHMIDALVPQMPLLLSMGMLLLCPTSGHARYMLPMMLTAPIFIAILSRIKIRK